MNPLVKLRQYLHQHPELSNRETATAAYILDYVKTLSPGRVIEVGATGLAFVFNGQPPGKTIVFRAELDALPIEEQNRLPYRSVNKGVSHVCGHDGHMAILCGLAARIAENRSRYGRVVLLFQPAEEVEQGAKDVISTPEFRELNPDYIFALHNIPGEPLHTVLIRRGSFAAASRGMTITLMGKSSHAGEPEKGINPAAAVARIINGAYALNRKKELFHDVAFITVINLQLGETAFGTSPGKAVVRLTLRTFHNKDMPVLIEKARQMVQQVAGDESLSCEISWSELFPATTSSDECVALIERAARANGLDARYPDKPFPWSEDFSYYAGQYNCGYFGLGSGVDQPALHHPDFDFPDELIETGVNMFYSICTELTEPANN